MQVPNQHGDGGAGRIPDDIPDGVYHPVVVGRFQHGVKGPFSNFPGTTGEQGNGEEPRQNLPDNKPGAIRIGNKEKYENQEGNGRHGGDVVMIYPDIFLLPAIRIIIPEEKRE
jgi:hypothetical protein